MINIIDKHNCCGCGACVKRCPKQCITMHEDNEGFLYPHVEHFKMNSRTVTKMFMYKQASLIDCCKYKNFTVINGDARDEETLKRYARYHELPLRDL